jgi:hypothetical protein
MSFQAGSDRTVPRFTRDNVIDKGRTQPRFATSVRMS